MVKIVILDNEIFALKMLVNLLENYEDIAIIGQFTEYSEMIDSVNFFKIDAVFIEVKVADEGGIDIARQIQRVNHHIDIVFVSDHQQYTLEAFEINAQDYLIKPVVKSRLDKTVERLIYNKTYFLKKIVPKKINVNCFGEFEVLDSNDIPIKWRTSKSKELAAFLLHKRGAFVSKEMIINKLWGKKVGSDRILYTTIYYLRHAFKKLGLKDSVILCNSNYKISLDQINLDLNRFDELINESSISSLKNAIDLYKDDYLLLNNYSWSYEVKESYRLVFEMKILKICDNCIRENNIKEAVKYIKLSLTHNPFQVDLSIMLIKIYRQEKNIVPLKNYFESLEMLYEEKLGIKIPSEITDIYIQSTQSLVL